ncbi:MAG: hypothetical protein JXQ83_09560 [Candidatus Glassbacteria bacterium]|nr:hypothetical protein [Candidatus Glassbacteria bacterium]
MRARAIRAVLLCCGLLLGAVATSQAAEHPGLYFARSDLPSLRREAKGVKALQFSRLQHWGDSRLKDSPPAEFGYEERHLENCFSAVTNFGLLYQVTGRGEYLEAGRRWLEALLDEPAGDAGYFTVAEFAAALAHGYDLFYQGLSPELRARLLARLVEMTELTRQGASDSWWAMIYTHHDFWIPVAFLGIAGICLQGEYEGAREVVEFAASELGKAMDLLGGKGYWPEGVADWVYGMAPALMFFDALKRAGGEDFYQRAWMKNTARARLRHWLPGDRYLYLGDSFPSGRYGVLGSVSAHLSMHLAARYRDSHAQWLALREAHADSAENAWYALENPYSYGTRVPVRDRERHGLAWQFLWYDPSVKPVPPDTLPADVLYPNWDVALFRAGWGQDHPVLAFCGGHLLGKAGTSAWQAGNRVLPDGLAHVHLNAGSLYLWADGRFPLAPPGFGGRDGRFHSTVMMDGHGQLFKADHTGRMTAFESAGTWAMAAADLTDAYPEEVELDRFERTLVYLKPRTILLMDRLLTRDGDKKYIRRYEWLLQTDASAARWSAGHSSLAVLPVADGNGEPWLVGRVFPSYRYYFEHQSLDRPDGEPLNRALSVTIIGRMPAAVQMASVLHAPAPGEDTGWINRVECLQEGSSTALAVPDGPYFIIPTGPQGRPPRTVVFAVPDSANIPAGVPEKGLLLVVGLAPQQRYGLEAAAGLKGKARRLVISPQGEYLSSEAGNLVLRPGDTSR